MTYAQLTRGVGLSLLLGFSAGCPSVMDAPNASLSDAGQLEQRADGGLLDDAGEADGGEPLDGGTTDGGTLLALLAPAPSTVGVDLVTCLSLTALDTEGHTVPLDPDTAGLHLELSPSTVIERGDRDDCPAGTLPVAGVGPGLGTVRLSSQLQGVERSVEGTLTVVATTGTLTGLADVVVQLGSSKVVNWSLTPSGLAAGARGRLMKRRLTVSFAQPTVGRLETMEGTRRLTGLARGTSEVEVGYPSPTLAAPSKRISLAVVAGTLTELTALRIVEPVARNRGARLAVGDCLRVEATGTFVDQGTSYNAVWPDAVIENRTPATLSGNGSRFCGTAVGDGALRVCFSGRCYGVGVAIGPSEPVSITFTGQQPIPWNGSLVTCLPVALHLFAGTGASRHDVTESDAVEWLAASTSTGVSLTMLEDSALGVPKRQQGAPCFSVLTTGTGMPHELFVFPSVSARYGGQTATLASPLEVQAP